MVQNYISELDDLPELNEQDITFYQELVGALRCAVEIRYVDILTELSMLSAYQVAPRQGHLEQIHYIFVYLKKKPKLTLNIDQVEPNIDPQWFKNGDDSTVFKEQCRDAV